MTPPRKKPFNEVTYDEEHPKRMRLAREDPYANGLSTVPLSRAAAARTTVPIVPLYPNYYTPAINSTFVQQANGSWNHHTYINQAEMYFFKNNDNSSEFSSKRCRSFFKVYASDSDPELIGPEGIEKLCNDLQVKPEDIVVLVLSWKLNAKVMGLYSLSEWLEGMNELKCDSVVKLRNKLDYLRSCLSDPTLFKSIYRYSFDFAKEPEQRCLDIDVAKQMLSLLLTNRWRIFPLFVEFLNQSKYKVINKDQYFNLLDFSRLVNDDLTNYDENSAWPVMLDEFVEWCRDFKGFKVPAVESGHTSDDQE